MNKLQAARLTQFLTPSQIKRATDLLACRPVDYLINDAARTSWYNIVCAIATITVEGENVTAVARSQWYDLAGVPS